MNTITNYAILSLLMMIGHAYCHEYSDEEVNAKIMALNQQLHKLQEHSQGKTTIQQNKEKLQDIKELYHKARFYLSQQNFKWAYEIFDKIVNNFAPNYYVALAMFWQAEKLLSERLYLDASLLYGKAYKMVKNVPKLGNVAPQEDKDKIPEMLAKMAFCLDKLGKKEEAKATKKLLAMNHKILSKSLRWFIENHSDD